MLRTHLANIILDGLLHAEKSYCDLTKSNSPYCHRLLLLCWNYKVMGSQRSYLKDLINDRDDADDEYSLIRNAVDAVNVYIDYMRTSSSQYIQSLVSTSRLILTFSKGALIIQHIPSFLLKISYIWNIS